jgi:hypothetical protein
MGGILLCPKSLAHNLKISNMISVIQTKMIIMRRSFWLIVLISSLPVVSCKKETTPEQQVYFNSFESKSDTVGWIGNAFNLDIDVPSHGGKKSLSVLGGCIIPHAEYTIEPQSSDCYLKIKFWGKNLSNGGSLMLAVNINRYNSISFDVSEKEWTLYESQDPLFCPANTSLTLGIISGGIYSSAILIDMIEITKLIADPLNA